MWDKETLAKTYAKYDMCRSTFMVICTKQYLATFKAQFMKKLSNTEVELKKKCCL